MKILHLGQMVGGIAIYIKNTTLLLSNEIDFVIVSGKNDNNKPLVANDKQIKEYKIDLYRELSLKDIKGLFQAIKIIRQEKPDLIHCHSAKGGFIGRIAGFLCGVPTLYTPHAFSFLSTQSGMKRRIFLMLERVARLNSYMLACSKSERELGMNVVGYNHSKALVWNNSVPDIKKESLAKVDKKQFNVCYIGRPCYQKNIQFLIEVVRNVVKQIPDMKLYLLGVGFYSPDLDEVKSLIKAYSLEEHIEMVEWLPQKEMFEYIKRADLYISTSIYEGLPLSIVEVMSLGCPIIASDVYGNKDCVFDGENGYLLPLDVESFKDKVVELYNNRELREQMGQCSRELFLENFCIDSQIDKLKLIYDKVSNY